MSSINDLLETVKGVANNEICPLLEEFDEYNREKNETKSMTAARQIFDDLLFLVRSDFSKSSCLEYLKKIIGPHKEKYSGANRDKTYANIMNNKGSVPSKEKLIQMCFDFSIRTHEKIKELFSACYRPQLYLKEKEDAAYYFLLTN